MTADTGNEFGCVSIAAFNGAVLEARRCVAAQGDDVANAGRHVVFDHTANVIVGAPTQVRWPATGTSVSVTSRRIAVCVRS